MNSLRDIKIFIRRLLFFMAKNIYLRIKIYLYKNILSTNNVKNSRSNIYQPTQFVGLGSIELIQVSIGVWPSPNFFNGASYLEARSVNSKIVIGENTFINNNATIICDKGEISIGNNCIIGPHLWITNSDFHGVSLKNRRGGKYECKNVCVGNNVFLGEGVKILKGVKIGDGAVVASGSIVTKDVPELAMVAGVPAKFIRYVG